MALNVFLLKMGEVFCTIATIQTINFIKKLLHATHEIADPNLRFSSFLIDLKKLIPFLFWLARQVYRLKKLEWVSIAQWGLMIGKQSRNF